MGGDEDIFFVFEDVEQLASAGAMAGAALDRDSAADGCFDAGLDEGGHACFFGF
jgi:hypothetical protein